MYRDRIQTNYPHAWKCIYTVYHLWMCIITSLNFYIPSSWSFSKKAIKSHFKPLSYQLLEVWKVQCICKKMTVMCKVTLISPHMKHWGKWGKYYLKHMFILILYCLNKASEVLELKVKGGKKTCLLQLLLL